MFSKACFGRCSGQIQGDVLITRIQNIQRWLVVSPHLYVLCSCDNNITLQLAGNTGRNTFVESTVNKIHRKYCSAFVQSSIPLACAECDRTSSIPLCCIPFPSTLFHQLVFHPSRSCGENKSYKGVNPD